MHPLLCEADVNNAPQKCIASLSLVQYFKTRSVCMVQWNVYDFGLTGREVSQPAGNSKLISCLNSAASSGYDFEYASRAASQSDSSLDPRSMCLLQ